MPTTRRDGQRHSRLLHWSLCVSIALIQSRFNIRQRIPIRRPIPIHRCHRPQLWTLQDARRFLTLFSDSFTNSDRNSTELRFQRSIKSVWGLDSIRQSRINSQYGVEYRTSWWMWWSFLAAWAETGPTESNKSGNCVQKSLFAGPNREMK